MLLLASVERFGVSRMQDFFVFFFLSLNWPTGILVVYDDIMSKFSEVLTVHPVGQVIENMSTWNIVHTCPPSHV